MYESIMHHLQRGQPSRASDRQQETGCSNTNCSLLHAHRDQLSPGSKPTHRSHIEQHYLCLNSVAYARERGLKPTTTFVSLSEVLILQKQYVKWIGGTVEWGAAVVYNGNLRFCSHFLFTNIPYPQPTESLSRTPTLSPRVAYCKTHSRQNDTRIELVTTVSLMKYTCHSLCSLFLWM